MPEGRDAVLEAARRVAREDEAANRELSRLGADWLLDRVDRPRLRVLTHCNTGFLATSAWGTAFGVIRELHARDRIELVYADETRPLLQGARLTAYELANDGIPHVVQADSAAASTILRGLVDLAVVGADRIAANGDAANKIGTVGVALACRDAGIPFMVAAPWSTVDLSMADGSGSRSRSGPARRSPSWPARASRPRGPAASTLPSTSPPPASSTRWRPSEGWPSPGPGPTCAASREREGSPDTRTAGRHPWMPAGRPVCGGVRRSGQRTTLNALTSPAP